MSTEHQKEDEVYIIPHNYTDNGKILGMFEKNAFILAAIWMFPVAIISFYLPFNFQVKSICFMILAVPAIFMVVGVGSDPFIDFVKFFYKFNKLRKIYHYEKH